MASRRGRRPSPPARRLILLGALNVIAATVLIATVLLRGDSAAAEGGPAPPAGDSTLALQPTRVDLALQQSIQTLAANAVREAGRRSEGRVTPDNTTVAVHVVDLASGGTLASVQGDRALRPASTLKLLTSVAALMFLGAEGQFETAFELVESSGDLVVRAGGDPIFTEDSGGGLEPWLDDLARQLRAAGLTRVRGALVLDEGTFLEPGPGPGWPSPNQHWTAWCALSAGFTANGGCLTARVTPGVPGGVAGVEVRPWDHGLPRHGSVTTGPRGSSNDVAVGANRGGVTVRGTIPADVSSFESRFAHPDPVELFGSAVVAGLERRGLPVHGGFRQQRGAPAGRAVARLRSPVTASLVPVLRESRNSIADQLLFATAHREGARGDRAGGQAVVAAALKRLGVDPGGLAVVDGSGLSRDDRVRPRQLTAALAAFRTDPAWEVLFEALPTAGETGSLAGRMRNSPARGRVHAKTGFIGGTSALAGIARTLDGRELGFALLVNYPPVGGLNTLCWKPMGDELARLLVESEDVR